MDLAVRTGRTRVVAMLLHDKVARRSIETRFDRVFRSALDDNWTEIAWDLLQADSDHELDADHLADWIDVAVRQGDGKRCWNGRWPREGPQIFVAARPQTLLRAASQEAGWMHPAFVTRRRQSQRDLPMVGPRSSLPLRRTANNTLQALLAFHAEVDAAGTGWRHGIVCRGAHRLP